MQAKQEIIKLLDILPVDIIEEMYRYATELKKQKDHTGSKPETLTLIERIENGSEKLIGPFSSKEELWRSLEI